VSTAQIGIKEKHQMFTVKICAGRNRVLVTTLTTLGWLVFTLGWMAVAWSRYSFFQNLAGLGISALLFAAIIGVVWVRDLAATILATLGWLSLVLYWIAFVWGRHTLLQNGAVLLFSSLVWLGIVAVFLLAGPASE
jgi:hypothetical protein